MKPINPIRIRTVFLIVFTLSIFSPYSFAAKRIYSDIIIDEVTSIYDGDTFRVTIKNYPPVIGERISVRVLGVDTPELRGKCQKEKELARLAKQFTVKHLREGKVITFEKCSAWEIF